jgi:hypothetical protein
MMASTAKGLPVTGSGAKVDSQKPSSMAAVIFRLDPTSPFRNVSQAGSRPGSGRQRPSSQRVWVGLTLDHVGHQLLRTTSNIEILQKTIQLSSIFTGLALESLVAVEHEILEVGMCGDPHSVRVGLDEM